MLERGSIKGTTQNQYQKMELALFTVEAKLKFLFRLRSTPLCFYSVARKQHTLRLVDLHKPLIQFVVIMLHPVSVNNVTTETSA